MRTGLWCILSNCSSLRGKQETVLLPVVNAGTNDLPTIVDAPRGAEYPARVWSDETVQIFHPSIPIDEGVHIVAAACVGGNSKSPSVEAMMMPLWSGSQTLYWQSAATYLTTS